MHAEARIARLLMADLAVALSHRTIVRAAPEVADLAQLAQLAEVAEVGARVGVGRSPDERGVMVVLRIGDRVATTVWGVPTRWWHCRAR